MLLRPLHCWSGSFRFERTPPSFAPVGALDVARLSGLAAQKIKARSDIFPYRRGFRLLCITLAQAITGYRMADSNFKV